MTRPAWQAGIWRDLSGALNSARVHHALLFATPTGLGKRALAEAFAAAALCNSRNQDGHACGHCRACALIAAGSHPDLVRIGLELRDDGKPRTEIIVDQMRALSARLAMSSQFGGFQIALIDPADRLNASAANALLKTLEEPATSTVIMLIADDAARLPATIRSRCRRVDMAAPSRDESLAWLRSKKMDPDRAEAALDAALGNPGRALAWVTDDTLALRDGCIDDLRALAEGNQTAAAVAERWAADRTESRLWIAATLAEQSARLASVGERSAFGLTARTEIPKLAAWFDRANRARALLATTLRAELVILDLLMSWPHTAHAMRRS